MDYSMDSTGHKRAGAQATQQGEGALKNYTENIKDIPRITATDQLCSGSNIHDIIWSKKHDILVFCENFFLN